MKWCNGACGRHLPLSAFYKRHSVCKGCHRVRARERWGVRSRRPGAKRARREKDRQRYATDPAWREKLCAAARARYWRARQAQEAAA